MSDSVMAAEIIDHSFRFVINFLKVDEYVQEDMKWLEIHREKNLS
jgi:hypothetical protein